MLDPRFVEQVAAALGTQPGLVEKEWHVVRALRVIANVNHGKACPVFSGGTSLSVGWGLIKRFSEDIDFKVAIPDPANPSQGRAQRRKFREDVLTALSGADFRLVGEPRKASAFFAADFAYPNVFDPVTGLRPHIQVEMTFQRPTLPPVTRPLRSLIGQAQKAEPEIASFPCVDPVETAADKLSALAWRVCARSRGSAYDDPTVVRHLHDLAALESCITAAPRFTSLLLKAAKADTGRGAGLAPKDSTDRFAVMLERLATDELWAAEYERFVTDKSFAHPNDAISFSTAVAATTRLIGRIASQRPQ